MKNVFGRFVRTAKKTSKLFSADPFGQLKNQQNTSFSHDRAESQSKRRAGSQSKRRAGSQSKRRAGGHSERADTYNKLRKIREKIAK